MKCWFQQEGDMNKEESLNFLQSRIEKVKNASEQDIQFYKEAYDKEDSSLSIKRWKRLLDIFPGEWFGTDHEKELERELEIGDYAKVVVDSQFQDKYEDDSKFPRLFGMVGKVIKIDTLDEWSYQLKFEDGLTNWFKRYVLEKID